MLFPWVWCPWRKPGGHALLDGGKSAFVDGDRNNFEVGKCLLWIVRIGFPGANVRLCLLNAGEGCCGRLANGVLIGPKAEAQAIAQVDAVGRVVDYELAEHVGSG